MARSRSLCNFGRLATRHYFSIMGEWMSARAEWRKQCTKLLTMASGEKTLESIANRIMDLDHIIDRNKRNVTFEDTINFVNSKKNSSTVSKTRSDIKKFRDRTLKIVCFKYLCLPVQAFIHTVYCFKMSGNSFNMSFRHIFFDIWRFFH
jgi:hypothetical protein